MAMSDRKSSPMVAFQPIYNYICILKSIKVYFGFDSFNSRLSILLDFWYLDNNGHQTF